MPGYLVSLFNRGGVIGVGSKDRNAEYRGNGISGSLGDFVGDDLPVYNEPVVCPSGFRGGGAGMEPGRK